MRTKSSLQLARRMFARAAELDPLYARAYAGIADCDSFLYAWNSLDVSLAAILELCNKALMLDPNLSEAYASRGLVMSTSGRHGDAVAAFDRALALDPGSREAHYFYARHLFAQGDFERAAGHYTRAADIRPDDYRSPPCA